MKRIFALLIAVGLLVAGCSDLGTNPDSVSPDLNNHNSTNYQFIPLPSPSDPAISVENVFYAGKYIKGDKGGKIKLNKHYWSDNGKVKVEADLEIPKNAFASNEYIFYFVDDAAGTVDFFPGMSFDKDLTFDLEFENVNLSDITNPDLVKFAYIDLAGNIVLADYDEIEVDLEEGKLEVEGAKIGHFSRFGFVK